jgi:hypothetical protein
MRILSVLVFACGTLGLACTQGAFRQDTFKPSRFAGCYAFSYGDGAGNWDAPLPRQLHLISDTAGSSQLYRADATYYWHSPSSTDSTFNTHPIWRLLAADSLEVDFSGYELAEKVLLLRAKGSAERLVGQLGRAIDQNGFTPLLSFTAEPGPCP